MRITRGGVDTIRNRNENAIFFPHRLEEMITFHVHLNKKTIEGDKKILVACGRQKVLAEKYNMNTQRYIGFNTD